MNNYMAHAYQVSREREWTNLQEIPAWMVPETTHRSGSHRVRRALAVLLIGATAVFGAIAPDSGSAHTWSPCFDWSSVRQMSVRPATLPRFQMIPGQPLPPKRCLERPGDPMNENLANRAFLI